eukprot:3661231-Rhodomonas_salina.1
MLRNDISQSRKASVRPMGARNERQDPSGKGVLRITHLAGRIWDLPKLRVVPFFPPCKLSHQPASISAPSYRV